MSLSLIRFNFSALFLILIWTGASPADSDQPAGELAARRADVMEKMGEGMLILFSGEPKNFSNDVYYPFRQESNLYYLTGINQPGITLLLFPENTEQREILFLPQRDRSQEVWTGRTLSQEEAAAISGITNVWDAELLEPFTNSLFLRRLFRRKKPQDVLEYHKFFAAIEQDKASVWVLLGDSTGTSDLFGKEHAYAKKLREHYFGLHPKDISPVLSELRLIKSVYEQQLLRHAIEITCEAHRLVMQRVQPEMYEYQLDGLIHMMYREYGAHWGFPSIVGSGPNATTLHYEINNRQMRDGELVLLDIGAAVDHYTADVTRTIPVNGVFTKEQRDIYEIVLKAQEEAIKKIRPGATISDVNEKAREVIKEGLRKLRLITDDKGDQYRMWFMHGACHWIGLDVHDVGERDAPFQPGMMLTVEPGIYVREDALDHLEDTSENQKLIEAVRPSFERYKNIGIRIEDDVLVTEDGYELLSGAAPRTVKDIEALMSSAQ